MNFGADQWYQLITFRHLNDNEIPYKGHTYTVCYLIWLSPIFMIYENCRTFLNNSRKNMSLLRGGVFRNSLGNNNKRTAAWISRLVMVECLCSATKVKLQQGYVRRYQWRNCYISTTENNQKIQFTLVRASWRTRVLREFNRVKKTFRNNYMISIRHCAVLWKYFLEYQPNKICDLNENESDSFMWFLLKLLILVLVPWKKNGLIVARIRVEGQTT